MDWSNLKERKALSAPGLLATVRTSFEKIPDHRNGSSVTHTIPDSLMSGLAIFGMKFPSLLQFDKMSRSDEYVMRNLKSLYGLTDTPSDTRVREIIDPIDSKAIRPAFKKIFASLQRGKAIETYQFYRGSVLVSVDGTGYFSSNEVHCENCCVKEHRNGTISYYHQMLGAAVVHPDKKNVIPLAPEPIIKQDGNKKNDCERNASKRFLEDLRREHPHLGVIIIEDALASNAPHIKLLRDLNFGFILGVKPGDHGKLFENVDNTAEYGLASVCEIKNGEITHKFKFINDVALNDSNEEVKINFLEYWEIGPNKTQHFSWVTDFNLTENNVFKIMRGGRARWKIENETFNTLKNQGYQFEHNFGHGYQNLSVNFVMLMMLAFLIDQVQDLCCQFFQAARASQYNKKAFWEKLCRVFRSVPVDDWEQLYRAVAYGYHISGVTFGTNTS